MHKNQLDHDRSYREHMKENGFQRKSIMIPVEDWDQIKKYIKRLVDKRKKEKGLVDRRSE